MTITEERLTLRVVEGEPTRGDSVARLNLQASIALTAFRGQSVFLVSVEALDDFLNQLGSVDEGRSDSAQIECGLLGGDVDVTYFRCHVEASPPCFIGHVSLGTGVSNGLLQRLHVGLRIAQSELRAFRQDLSHLMASRSGAAVLRGLHAAQPNKLQPTSRARKKAKSKPRSRAARGRAASR